MTAEDVRNMTLFEFQRAWSRANGPRTGGWRDSDWESRKADVVRFLEACESMGLDQEALRTRTPT